MAYQKRSHSQRGVSMVEFALICMLFFATIGFFIELSIAYFNYQLLVTTTATAARQVGVNAVFSNTGTPCAEIEDNSNPQGAAQRAQSALRSAFGINEEYFRPVRFCGDVRRDADNRCYIRIRGKWPFQCFFCLFYKGGAVLNAEGEAYIEDECFDCAGAGICSDERTDVVGATAPGVNCFSGNYSDQVPG
jgi:hypothetical protein